MSIQLVYSLERLDKITAQTPETAHEENFQKCFGSAIQNAIERLKMPVDATNPQKNWEPLKQVNMLHISTCMQCFASCLGLQPESVYITEIFSTCIPSNRII